MRLGWDLDGVLAEGKYLVQPERASETYRALKPIADPAIWRELCAEHDCYIITARSYKGAVNDVYQWLTDHDLLLPAGVMCGDPYFTQENMVLWKLGLIHALNLQFYLDDSPMIYTAGIQPDLPAYLMDNPTWPENQQLKTCKQGRLKSWKEIETTIASLSDSKLHKS